jgi:hypothetical protein
LAQYDLQTQSVTTKIGLTKDIREWRKIGWTKDDYITLTSKNNFIVLDIANKKVVSSMPIETNFITIAGFIN